MLQTDNLKILIVSTPKTGNTWCRQLLSTLYDLPMVDASPLLRFKAEEFEELGPRWVTHHHYPFIPELLDWAKTRQVALVTTVRHPADTLLSLYHYVYNYRDSPPVIGVMNEIMKRTITIHAPESFAQDLEGLVRQGFDAFIAHSLYWLRTGYSLRIAYEDMWYDPVAALKAITDRILPLPLEQLERAIEYCDIRLLRATSGPMGSKFYRRGGVGEWREALPPFIAELLQKLPPYPDLFAELGYNMNPLDPLYSRERHIPAHRNPFRTEASFDNGVLVTSLIIQCYLSIATKESEEWGQAQNTQKSNSFFAWLNAPARKEDTALPLITNLATYLYRKRPDLLAAFPDIFGQNRVDYARWFIQYASQEYTLDNAFIEMVSNSLTEWGNTPAAGYLGSLPLITNQMIQIYQQRPDLQVAFPEIAYADRVAFARWFVQYASQEYTLDKTFIDVVADSLAEY